MRFTGQPVSAGMAAGRLHIAGVSAIISATPDQVRAAFAAVAADRGALAERLRLAGRDAEAAIIDIGALIAADSALVEPAVAAVRGGGDAVAAVRQAAEAQAAVLQALPVLELAQRADDVRQVGQAVLDFLDETRAAPPPAGDFILVRREVSPAELVELAETGLVGAASVAGGASSHASIIARGLGVPMIAGIDPVVLAAPAGQLGVLNADAGELIIDPSAEELGAASAGNGDGQPEHRTGGPALTADGCEIAVLCNVASPAETRRGLAAGAVGVGLLRTEIPYAGALAWPTPAEHRAQLAPILGLLDGRTATVRLLDFSGDKIPPFLRGRRSAATAVAAAAGVAGSAGVGSAGTAAAGLAGSSGVGSAGVGSAGVGSAGVGSAGVGAPGVGSAGDMALPGQQTGLAALLAHPCALRDQLDAVLDVGRRTDLAVLVPMVSSLAEVRQVRDVLSQAAAQVGVAPPPLGIMVELQATAAAAAVFAPEVDFLSIGTNDLTGQVLGLDRLDPAASPSLAAHPQVLALIAHVTEAGRQAGISVSVCGDSAADPLVLPLLVGAGVRTLSVPAARVRQVRSAVTDLDSRRCATLAAEALAASSVDEVWKLVLAR